MVKRTPPMGWNTWNTFAENINEDLLKKNRRLYGFERV